VEEEEQKGEGPDPELPHRGGRHSI
jgi:hypothetical protein